MYTVTYHHRWIVPLLVSACGIWVDAVIDDLERCQANGLHGAKVGLPEPACLWTDGTDILKCTHESTLHCIFNKMYINQTYSTFRAELSYRIG